MSTFAAPSSATSGLQGYDLEGADKHKKVSKEAAAYTADAKTSDKCRTCTMFMSPDACTKVKGNISPGGHCRFYYAVKGASKIEARLDRLEERRSGVAKSAARTLYIKRRVRNGEDLVNWAKAAGFPTALPADDMHVTIAYSKKAVEWELIPRSDLPILRITGGARKLKRLGKDGEAAVLGIESDELTRRWGDIHAAGAVWSWPNYQPHITISYAANHVDIDKIIPHDGMIELGPEEWDEVKENWMDTVVEKNAPLMAAGIALVTNEGRALFLKRSESCDHAGEWNFPGGGIEAGETVEDAAIREAFEEAGIKLDAHDDRVQVARVAGRDVDYTTFFQRVEAEFEPKLNSEHVAHRWESLEKPPEPLHPGVRAVLPMVISQATELTMKVAKANHVAGGGDPGELNMNDLSLFVQLRKVDAKERIVYGTAVVEQVDRAGEIFDYASSKPEFEKWSSAIAKTTDGKSLGNVRSMHANIAAGKLVDIGFDDARKAIDVAAKVVDDNEWKKVEEGVYTGFSIGGKYIKKWQDGDAKRYTAAPSEVSLVDMPCVPDATFSMIKVDGTEELRKFVQPAAATAVAKEITNAMVVERANALAKAAGKDWVEFVVEARAQLQDEMTESVAKAAGETKPAEQVTVKIKVDATEALAEVTKVADAAKAAAEAVAAVTPTNASGDGEWEQVWVSKRLPGQTFAKKSDLAKALVELDAKEAAEKAAAPVLEALRKGTADPDPIVKQDGESDEDFAKRQFSAAQRKKDAKSGAAESDGSYPIEDAKDLENAIHAYGRSRNKPKTKRHIIARARALGLTDKLPEGWVKAKKAADTEELKKAASLYFVADLLNMLSCVESLEEQAEFTSLFGGIAVPKELTDRFGSALVELGDITAAMLELVLGEMREEEASEAAKAVELVDLVKRGARHNARDKAIIKQVHDHMVDLDKACCGGGMDKTIEAAAGDLEKVTAENDALKAEKNANAVLMQDILAGINAMKAEREAERAELKKEIEGLKKSNDEVKVDLTAIRMTPVPPPHGQFRIVEKGGAPVDHTTIPADELAKRGAAAALFHRPQ